MSAEKNAEFRKAAADGNLKQVQDLLKDYPTIDINSAGSSAGNTALHFAAERGHFLVVEYLVSKGANIDLKNTKIKPETALDKASNPETKMFLSMVKPLREAIAFAKKLFPDEATQGYNAITEKIKQQVPEILGRLGQENYKEWKEYAAHQSPLNPKDVPIQQPMLEEHSKYSEFILHQVAVLEANLNNNKEGRCQARSVAAFAYLVMKGHINYPIDDITISVPNTRYNHEVLLIGRDPKWTLDQLKSDKYAIFCDAYREGSFYSSRNIPEKSSVSDIVKKGQDMHEVNIHARPSGEGFKAGRPFFEKTWNKAFDKFKYLLPEEKKEEISAPKIEQRTKYK
jgi:hypothetical protein